MEQVTFDKAEQDAFNEYIKKKIKDDRKRALRALFAIEDIDCDFIRTKKHFFVFYWLKTFICLLLNRQTYFDYKIQIVEVLKYDEYMGYEFVNWTSCDVGRGIFKNWKVYICEKEVKQWYDKV